MTKFNDVVRRTCFSNIRQNVSVRKPQSLLKCYKQQCISHIRFIMYGHLIIMLQYVRITLR